MAQQVCLIVRDGWGLNEREEGNAVAAASTPNNDAFKAKYPWTTLLPCGEAVGLPEGYQGSSEVGHMNMGAGNIVIQELKRIDDGLSTGALFEEAKWKEFVAFWKSNQSTMHLLGLLQDEGVHAHQEHLFKIMRRAREEYPEGKIVVHPFLDGRDTPPRSTLEYIAKLSVVLAETNATIGTVMGRYYGMDRSKNYELTSQAYHTLVCGEGRKADSAEAAVEESYANDKTPDGDEMVDEYILPYCIGDFSGIQDGDCVFHTNYRQDRAIQLTEAFVKEDYPGARKARPQVKYLGFSRYWDEFEDYLLPLDTGEEGSAPAVLLGKAIADAGCQQLRIAETQKFRHVTSFFNGKATTPFPGEEQVDVTSRFDPSSFASHPEMEAYNVTDKLIEILEADPKKFDFVAVNYANCDMVGHTGQLKAATKAVEIIDECQGKLVEKLLALGFKIIVTADHGNSDQMIDYETGKVKTSHTLNPVECIYIAEDAPGTKMLPEGKLADIAPTILYLMGIDIPESWDANNLICAEKTCCQGCNCG